MSDTRAWSAVLFDLDGTLADTVELILRSYRHTMETHLGEAPPDQRFLATMGKPLPVQIRDFASDEAQAAAMRQTYVTFQRGIHDEMVKPYPGVRSVLEQLRDQGVRLGVVTSKASGIAGNTLECCGLLHYIDFMVCANQVTRPKPHPESVTRAIDHFELADRPEDVVFVGDSPFDMRAGREAGVKTAAALWGPFAREPLEVERPDFWLEGIEGLLETGP
jgi:pyrophosphatase PpaX